MHKYVTYVRKVNIESIGENDSIMFKRDTHDRVIINGGEFVVLMHKGMSHTVMPDFKYIFYYARPDVHHDRYIEVFEVVRD